MTQLGGQPKLNKDELHRRPEFDDNKAPGLANASSSCASGSSCAAGPSKPMVKPEPVAQTMPPPIHIPQRIVHFSPEATSTPNGKGKAPLQPNGLHTPVQTPAGLRVAQGHNVGGMAEKTAQRHAARLKAIQEAQEAQRRGEGAARAAATDPDANGPQTGHNVSAPGCPAPSIVTDTAAGPSTTTAGGPCAQSPQIQSNTSSTSSNDSDEFHFPSDDDAFFANIDFDALDEGIGRPIDFDEGKTGVEDIEVDTSRSVDEPSGSMADKHALQVASRVVQSGVQTNGSRASVAPQPQPRPQPQSRPQHSTSSVASGSSDSARPHLPNAHRVHNASSGAGIASAANVNLNNERARTPSMGGGFSFPAGVRPSLVVYPFALLAMNAYQRVHAPRQARTRTRARAASTRAAGA